MRRSALVGSFMSLTTFFRKSGSSIGSPGAPPRFSSIACGGQK